MSSVPPCPCSKQGTRLLSLQLEAEGFTARFDKVDATHLAIGGFSDGASYALSLGLSNGDLFTHIIAFSPGFMRPARRQGKPRIYISHGKFDTILPVDRCSRVLVPRLEREGYEVRYHEFNGIHTVPRAIAHEAVSWFLGKKDKQ